MVLTETSMVHGYRSTPVSPMPSKKLPLLLCSGMSWQQRTQPVLGETNLPPNVIFDVSFETLPTTITHAKSELYEVQGYR